MLVDINKYKSHSKKSLLTHTIGVVDIVKGLTNSSIAEISAIFHDVGKLNPNFQRKFDKSFPKVGNYSNHSTISAYAFWCFINTNAKKFSSTYGKSLSNNDVISIIMLIGKHHGNLPDFIPLAYTGNDYLFNEDEVKDALKLIDKSNLPIVEFTKKLLSFTDFTVMIKTPHLRQSFIQFGFNHRINTNPLQYYQETQFSFASLLFADKKDAGCIDIDGKKNVAIFCKNYNNLLKKYLDTLKVFQDIPINKLRTTIRKEAVSTLGNQLETEKRVFDLTAPTGSGKTLMLLSLAGKIIENKCDFRIIYILPFLSITEQVEKEVYKIFKGQENHIQRIDSKSENSDFEKLQKELESNPDTDKINELLALQFAENTFSYPFVITTFVRFFETLLSNKNATLLKLPNLSKSIFLIDEIQSLPPRLYGFFVAYLDAFCRKFNSYAIVSTATMPNFELPEKKEIIDFFNEYQKPIKLLSDNYFNKKEFNRYKIVVRKETISVKELAYEIIQRKESVLVILNTIEDSKDLYKILSDSFSVEELFLLNTHFTPNDRKKKIKKVTERLKDNNKTILISTQLIEAGVDIDFPVLYRDMAVMSSIVQSAGRCNRNGKLEIGEVILFRLENHGKERSKLIYRGKDEKLLSFTKDELNGLTYKESELFSTQKSYFERLRKELLFGEHSQNSPKEDFDFIKDITYASFEKIGKFRLIDKNVFGESYNLYIPINEDDNSFEKLIKLHKKQKEAFQESLEKGLAQKSLIKAHLKKMSGQILQVRINPQRHSIPSYLDKYYDLYLIDRESYNYHTGIKIDELYEII